jgi:cytochrome oxidase assembly protein ShyY1
MTETESVRPTGALRQSAAYLEASGRNHHSFNSPAMRRSLLLYGIALVVAIVCVRLGLWQYARHQERATYNQLVEERLSAAPVSPSLLPPDGALREYRRVELRGRFEPSGEWVLANRSNGGSPGVNFLTPLRSETGEVIVVNRGWAYAPDGKTVDRTRFRETGQVTVSGFAMEFEGEDGPPDDPANRVMRRARRAPFAAADADIAPFYVVALSVEHEVARSEAASRDSLPARLSEPMMGTGAHLSYMMQWFAFGAIALVGAYFLDRQMRRRRSPESASAADDATDVAAPPHEA